MNLRISTDRADGAARLRPVGDVDLSSADVLQDAIDSAFDGDPDTVLVDLEAVGFLDSSGITVLVAGRQMAEERGVRYRVIGATGTVARVLELAGVAAYLAGRPS